MTAKTVRQVLAKRDRLKARLRKQEPRENFGDREVRRLEDYVGAIWDYDYHHRRTIDAIVREFARWCSEYTGKVAQI